MNAGWFCAGEAGPEEAEALEDDAMDGGLVDMVPNQGSTAARVTCDDGRDSERPFSAQVPARKNERAGWREESGKGWRRLALDCWFGW